MGSTASTQVVDQITDAAEGRPGPRLRLYSGHDTTILPFLRMLQVDFDTWPPFTANIVLELWKLRSGQAAMRVLYNGRHLHLPGDKGDASAQPRARGSPRGQGELFVPLA